jgi:16S rRNA (cytosine967-C5)-methyltransferase
MTPAARVSAAITVLDDILDGRTAEKALSDWGRSSRFAGSKDRAALRDLVFDALRKRASCAARGGSLTGRGLMLGLCADSDDPALMFTGEGHAPAVLTSEEIAHLQSELTLPVAVANDMPDWVWPVWQDDLGEDATDAAQILRSRAPLYLRVNQRRGSIVNAIASLAAEGVAVSAHEVQLGCLRVETNPRRVKLSQAYETGLIEVQDAASQTAVSQLTIPDGARVLDYCAGGGGKALAISDGFDCSVTAHDIAEQRMKDIAPRAERAGANILQAQTDALEAAGLFDVVIVDAPCGGSGTWRRNPEAKWAFTENKLNSFSALQAEVIATAATYVRPGGMLYYMTCSVFTAENDSVVDGLIARDQTWSKGAVLKLVPSASSDGFYMCQLTKTE